jgi:hypothetical protein
MDRHRSLLMAGATVLLALGAGQYMASGTAESTAAMLPVPSVATPDVKPPLRLAAGTPFAAVATSEPPPFIIPAAATPDHERSLPRDLRTSTVPDACPLSLDVFTGADAMLSVTLTAPCAPNQTLVLRHAGLAVTYQTTASGSFFTDIPALDAKGAVTIRLADGIEISASSPVPEVNSINRLVVQGMAEDRFSLRADLPLIPLGQPSGPVPMLAEVATWHSEDLPRIAIESEVTAATCGRELLGEVLLSEAGKIRRVDLSMAMPDCDGEDGFVALNNPLPDMKLAATE